MPRAPVAATPIAFVRAIVQAYRARGLDPSGALAAAQIAPRLLRDPGARITAAQMETVSGHAMHELDDEGLGWFSRRLPWGSYGMLARASLAAPDLGVALKRWCRHHALICDDIALAVEVAGSVATLRLDPSRLVLDDPGQREFCLVSTLRNAHGYACWLVDSRIPLHAVRLPLPADPHTAPSLPLMFPGAAIEHGAADAGFDFDASYLALPVRRDERALNAMLQRALRLTVRPYRRDGLIVQRVRDLLHDDPSRTAEALAAALNVSARTLHRQLRDGGASLQALKDEARRERAIALLLRTDRSLKQVAAAAGFRNEKSFARAFRAWTGVPPGQYRSGSATDDR